MVREGESGDVFITYNLLYEMTDCLGFKVRFFELNISSGPRAAKKHTALYMVPARNLMRFHAFTVLLGKPVSMRLLAKVLLVTVGSVHFILFATNDKDTGH